jgi:hypothetical protein
MAEDPLAQAVRLLGQAAALINSSADPLAALLVAEGGSRLMDRTKIAQIAAIERDGSFAEKRCKTKPKFIPPPWMTELWART